MITPDDLKDDPNLAIDELLVALDDTSNHSILNLTTSQIEDIKTKLFADLGLNEEQIYTLREKLQDYIYVDEIPDLKVGGFIRWIPLNNPNEITLTKGGYVCDINICSKGTMIVLKSHLHKYFQVCLDSCLIFRKLNGEEKVLLAAMNYLAK